MLLLVRTQWSYHDAPAVPSLDRASVSFIEVEQQDRVSVPCQRNGALKFCVPAWW